MEQSEVEQKQRAYYNSIAAHYDRHYHSVHAVRYRTELFDALLGSYDFQGKLTLDAMCGGGENTAYLLAKGATVKGIDISDEQCRLYAERYPQCEVECGSMLSTPYPDNYFDLIVVESLHHLHPELDKGVAEVARILKPGGLVLMWEPSAGSLLDCARKLWYRLDKKYFEDNEKSLSISDVLRTKSLALKQARYGGNFGYFLVFSSMHLRIPPNVVGRYASLALWLERAFNRIQGRLLSAWVLALVEKR